MSAVLEMAARNTLDKLIEANAAFSSTPQIITKYVTEQKTEHDGLGLEVCRLKDDKLAHAERMLKRDSCGGDDGKSWRDLA